jgi:hypothetical protein
MDSSIIPGDCTTHAFAGHVVAEVQIRHVCARSLCVWPRESRQAHAESRCLGAADKPDGWPVLRIVAGGPRTLRGQSQVFLGRRTAHDVLKQPERHLLGAASQGAVLIRPRAITSTFALGKRRPASINPPRHRPRA